MIERWVLRDELCEECATVNLEGDVVLCRSEKQAGEEADGVKGLLCSCLPPLTKTTYLYWSWLAEMAEFHATNK